MIYSTLKLIILYLLSIALLGIDKFHSYLIDYGWWKPVALLYSLLLIIKFGAKIKNQSGKKEKTSPTVGRKARKSRTSRRKPARLESEKQGTVGQEGEKSPDSRVKTKNQSGE